MSENDEWKSEEYTFSVFPNHLEEDDMLKILMAEDVVFINNGWWNKDWPKDHITLHVNCNDVFAWACADAEDLLYSEIQELYKYFKKDKDWGAAAWCIKKRKQRPQAPVEKILKEGGIWDVDELLKENT